MSKYTIVIDHITCMCGYEMTFDSLIREGNTFICPICNKIVMYFNGEGE